jgi:hypothetical protein
MSAEYRKSKKRGRGLSPILKFTLIFILLFAAGFLIFYSIDNPGFIKEKFSPSRGADESGEFIRAVPEESIIRSADGNGESATVIAPGEDEEEGGEGSGPETGEESGEAYAAEDEAESAIPDETASSGGEEGNDTRSEDDNRDNGGTAESLSFWQRIINFITRREDSGEKVDVYPSRLEINFYFSGLGGEKKLVSEKRTINAGSPENAVQNAINELLKGPLKPHYFPVIPAGTKVLGTEVNENIAKIDFSQEFLENSLDTRILDEYIIYSIVNTLTEIPTVDGVIFYIEGVRIRMYGNVDLTVPSIRNKGLIEEGE